MSAVYAGLDWASQTHAVCVLDIAGSITFEGEVAHTADGLDQLMRSLRSAKVERIAIERPSGLLVDALMESGFTVVPIHPNVVKASRPRYRSHGGKSDASDAYLLADLMRTDGHRFRPLTAQSEAIRTLRALVRARDDLVASRTHLSNQLRSLLESYWPGAAAVFADIASPIALQFILAYPTPRSAKHLGAKRMAAFCAHHGYSGRRSGEDLLANLRQAPVLDCLSETESVAKGVVATSFARILMSVVEQIRALTQRVEQHVQSIDDGGIIMSFPRAGHVCAAQILAELGSVRERFLTDAQLAAEAGVAPVTYASGKVKAVTFRWACNHRLRTALTCFADNSRHANAWAAAVYAKARARGCDHPHAIRVLARAWVRVIWRAWMNRKPYDPQLHRGAQLLAEG